MDPLGLVKRTVLTLCPLEELEECAHLRIIYTEHILEVSQCSFSVCKQFMLKWFNLYFLTIRLHVLILYHYIASTGLWCTFFSLSSDYTVMSYNSSHHSPEKWHRSMRNVNSVCFLWKQHVAQRPWFNITVLPASFIQLTSQVSTMFLLSMQLILYMASVTNYVCQRARLFLNRHFRGWTFKYIEIKWTFLPNTLVF